MFIFLYTEGFDEAQPSGLHFRLRDTLNCLRAACDDKIVALPRGERLTFGDLSVEEMAERSHCFDPNGDRLIAWPIVGAALVAVLALAQTAPGSPGSSGAALLLVPCSGVPVSFEQIEDRSPRPDNASGIGAISSKCYRDSSGRLRLEEYNYTLLIDPIAGYRTFLSKQVAYRTPWPKSAEGRLVFFGIGDSPASSHNWTARTENIGTRAIEGIEFKGTRVIQTAEGEPTLTKTVEQWYSDDLKLIGFAVASASNETHTIRIQNVRREEPDPTLFMIPSDYKVLDLKLP